MLSLLFVFSGAPHTRLNAQEGLDALLMGSAFTDCRVLFLGDGIRQLMQHQAAEEIGRKNFTQGFAALADYGVTSVACRATDLELRNLKPEELVIQVECLDDAACRALMDSSDRILNFS